MLTQLKWLLSWLVAVSNGATLDQADGIAEEGWWGGGSVVVRVGGGGGGKRRIIKASEKVSIASVKNYLHQHLLMKDLYFFLLSFSPFQRDQCTANKNKAFAVMNKKLKKVIH